MPVKYLIVYQACIKTVITVLNYDTTEEDKDEWDLVVNQVFDDADDALHEAYKLAKKLNIGPVLYIDRISLF